MVEHREEGTLLVIGRQEIFSGKEKTPTNRLQNFHTFQLKKHLISSVDICPLNCSICIVYFHFPDRWAESKRPIKMRIKKKKGEIQDSSERFG